MHKAFFNFNIKSLDEDERIIRGIATTGRTDRVNDVIEPLGVRFAKSVPLLVAHSHQSPVGTVKFEKPTKDGVAFEARLPKITEPGPLKDRVDTAWLECKFGLIRDVSVGFRPIDGEVEPIAGGGLRFKQIEIFELSLVAVPANPDARILEVRAADARRTQSAPKFTSAAERRKQRGALIADEKRHVRAARRALAHFLGEKNVPRFETLAALERWDDARQRAALAKGAMYIGYEHLMTAVPKLEPIPVVRLR